MNLSLKPRPLFFVIALATLCAAAMLLIPPQTIQAGNLTVSTLRESTAREHTLLSPLMQVTNCDTVTEIPVTECNALVALYNSTDGPNWTDNTGWNVTNTPCSWYGVTCALGRVSLLYLYGNQLDGSIPDLSALTNLVSLSLGNNHLSGGIPDLSALSSLQAFSSEENQLSGTIPVAYLPASLQNLNLGHNMLSGTLPDLSAFSSLLGLSLGGNQLSGTLEAAYLPVSLQTLGLYENQFTGAVPDLSALTNLQMVLLQSNQLSGTIPASSFPASLQYLDLGWNALSGTLPDLSALSNLSQLFVEANQLSGTLSGAYLPVSLQYLGLHWNQFTGATPDLSALTNLISVALSWNQLSGTIMPSHFPASLQHLSLQGNQLTGGIPDFSVLPNLQTLQLSYNQLSGTLPDLSPLSNLNVLWLHNNYLTGEVPASITALVNIFDPDPNQYLNINHNCLTTIDPAVIAYLESKNPDWNLDQITNCIVPAEERDALETLYTSTDGPNWANNTGWMSADSPCSWYGVTCSEGHVTSVMLADNLLSGIIPDLSALTHLGVLNMSGNSLTGTLIPAHFPTSLQQLSLFGNQLSGDFPDWSAFTDMLTLYLSHNQLTGSIPDLSALTQLRLLWINNNHLTGEVPVSFSTLNVFDPDPYPYLDIGYNCLTAADPVVIAYLAVKDPDWNVDQTTNCLITSGSISGRVYDNVGAPPSESIVIRHYKNGERATGWLAVNLDGTYRLDGLEFGASYVVCAASTNVSNPNTYAAECWQETPSALLGTPIVPTAETPDFTGINFTLSPGSTLSGVVYAADGVTPIEGGAVLVQIHGYPLGWCATSGETFTIPGLTISHAYTVSAGGDYACVNRDYREEWWQESSTAEGATPVVILPGGTTGLTFTLQRTDLSDGGSISGRVYDNVGAPLSESIVIRHYKNGERATGWLAVNPDGTYRLSNLELGASYIVCAASTSVSNPNTYAAECWQEKPSSLIATPLVPTAETPDFTGINFTLSPGSTLSGVVYAADGVTPIEGGAIYVQVHGFPLGWCAVSGETFTIPGLTIGHTYTLSAGGDIACFNRNYQEEWFRESSTAKGATPVMVLPGGTGGIRFTLRRVDASDDWTPINESEFYREIDGLIMPENSNFRSVLVDFMPGEISLVVRMLDDQLINVTMPVINSSDRLVSLQIGDILLDGMPAPTEYVDIIHRDLMPLIVDSLDSILIDRYENWRNVEGLIIGETGIEVQLKELLPLPEPTGLVAAGVSQTQVDLTWIDNSSDETAFHLERSLDGIDWEEITTVGPSVTAYNDTLVVCGTTYHYSVRAYRDSDSKYSKYSDTATASTQLCPLIPPSALAVTAVSPTQVGLSWTDNAPDETAFSIERSPDGIAWAEIATVGANGNTYNDTSIACETPYHYRVLAYRNLDGAYSTPSNTATTTTPPCSPTGLVATPASQTQMNLTWADNSNTETAFAIERSINGGTTWTEIGTVSANVTGYSDTTVLCGQTTTYRVRAYRSGGSTYSAYSNQDTARILPDGSGEIVFNSDRDGDYEIYTMNLDGSNLCQLTENTVLDNGPSWSSDGTRIAYRSLQNNDNIWIMNADGTNQTRLTSHTSGWSSSPEWSPDDNKITYIYGPQAQNAQVRVINTDGSGSILIANTPYDCVDPVWSPDGARIAFSSRVTASDNDLHVINANGSNRQTLINNTGRIYAPAWSPDGTKITFQSDHQGNYEIYVVNSNGAGQVRLTTHTATDQMPRWSPDGTSIIFSSNRDGNWELYRINTDGTNTQRLTNTSFNETSPGWRTEQELTPLEAPSALMAVASATQIDLTWTDNSTDETAFHIERSTDDGATWSEIGTVGANVTAYSDTTVSAGTLYAYRVRAYRSSDAAFSAYAYSDSVLTPASSGVVVETIIENSTLFNSGTVNYVHITTGDATNDGAPDIVVIKGYPPQLATFQGSGSTWDGGALLSGPASDGATRPLVAPIRNDGQNWVVYDQDQSGNTAEWLRSNRYSGTTMIEDYTIASRADWPGRWLPVVADLDGDTNIEIWAPHYYSTPSHHLRRYTWNGTSFDMVEYWNGGVNWWLSDNADPVVDDFRGDDTETLVWMPTQTQLALVEYTPGEGLNDHTNTVIYTAPAVIYSLDAGEFDGLAGTDIVLSTWNGTTAEVYLVSGQTFTPTQIVSGITQVIQSVRLGDLNGNGRVEIYAAGSGGGIYGYDMASGWQLLDIQTGMANSWSGATARWSGASRDEVLFGVSTNASSTSFRIIRLSAAGVFSTPTDLIATAASQTQVDLTWADNSSTETAFYIERSTDDGATWSEIGTVGANVTAYSDTTTLCGQTTTYRVRAYRSGDATYSDYSNTDAARILPDGSGEIAFTSDRDGDREIYVMNLDGSGLCQLTENDTDDTSSDWSHDGSRLAFTAERDGNSEIYVMDADGTNVQRLTNYADWDTEAVWSPDGSRLVFTASDYDADVYVMDADGGNRTKLTDNYGIDDFNASWSPDGTQIVFISRRVEPSEIYVMNADGSSQTRITNNSYWDEASFLSPDGTRIVFVRNDGDREIYVMDFDGSNEQRLTNNPAQDLNPRWSPDGTKIIFHSNRDGNFELYVMNVDGTNTQRLTSASTNETFATWRP